MKRWMVYLSVALFLWQCASTDGTRRPRRLPNVIRAEEIQQSLANVPLRTAYDVIQYLRPQFLRQRGTTSGTASGPAMPVVYVNGMRYGGVRSLKNIFTEQVLEIRYLSPSDATTRFGIGHTGGAILVTTK